MGRYLDIDGDGILIEQFRTHPTKGSFFTRGTSHDAFAGYTEDGRINAETLKELPRNLISQLGIYQNQLGRTLNKKLILD